jgi:hypothetical protein
VHNDKGRYAAVPAPNVYFYTIPCVLIRVLDALNCTCELQNFKTSNGNTRLLFHYPPLVCLPTLCVCLWFAYFRSWWVFLQHVVRVLGARAVAFLEPWRDLHHKANRASCRHLSGWVRCNRLLHLNRSTRTISLRYVRPTLYSTSCHGTFAALSCAQKCRCVVDRRWGLALG